ncbi:MAG: winged helix-turn-helix transcriptional regulator [Chloroflexi bacterium]|nr:winged helix-turn-helix transcriptional regulator [Chloroflexota bacterium]
MNVTTLTALAEPNRLRIIELLRDKPCSVGEIANRLSLRQPQASKHLRVLSNAGLVKARPVTQQRIYQLQPKPFEELDGWLETFRRIWDTRFNKLDEILQDLQEEQKRDSSQVDQRP